MLVFMLHGEDVAKDDKLGLGTMMSYKKEING